jgi:hypothetical protein
MRLISMALAVCLVWMRWSPFVRGCPFIVSLAATLQARATSWRSRSSIGTGRRAVVPALSRALRVAIVVIVPAAVPALAYASSPDPLWIQGIYDDADHDDVVALATSGTGNVAPVGSADLQPIPPLIGNLPDSDEIAPVTRPASALHPRAPPTS